MIDENRSGKMDEAAFTKLRALLNANERVLPYVLDSLFEYARLGLWAEKHGIPALKAFDDSMLMTGDGSPMHSTADPFLASEALEALPKNP